MMTQWKIRTNAITIHPVRRSRQQHLRINNIFCCFLRFFSSLSTTMSVLVFFLPMNEVANVAASFY